MLLFGPKNKTYFQNENFALYTIFLSILSAKKMIPVILAIFNLFCHENLDFETDIIKLSCHKQYV